MSIDTVLIDTVPTDTVPTDTVPDTCSGGICSGNQSRSAWQALFRRLRRWWQEDRIRLSSMDFVDDPADTVRVDDRLQIDRTELRLVRRLGSPRRFEARDRDDRSWVVEGSEEGFRLTTPGGRVLRLPQQAVLVVSVSAGRSP